MDDHAPPSLQDLCLVCVCQNLDMLCCVCDDASLCFRSCPVFPPELSDLLLRTLTDEGLLNDRTLGIFRNLERLRLKRVCVRGSRLTAASFRRCLFSHSLKELDASHVLGEITISDIIHGLSSSQACRQSLQRLNVSALDRVWDTTLSFKTLQGLRSLSVALTPLDDSTLEDICSLPLLENLDISGTNVTHLTPLLRLRWRLRSLAVHAMHHLRMDVKSVLSVLSELKLLTHLDVSNDRMQESGEMIRTLLQETQILPALVALDVSGWTELEDGALKVFLEARPGMRFIGLLGTGAGTSDFLSGEETLKVAGGWNLTQLCEALRRYMDRESFLQEALRCLCVYLNDAAVSCRPEVLKLVYLGMKAYSKCVNVQLAGLRCVFNLTSPALAEGMPQSLLGSVMRLVIATMRNFPDHTQIQKICLLTLSNDHILKFVPFDRCEAAKQVIMCLITNEDEEFLQSLSASLIVLQIAQLTPEESARLGAEESIIQNMLHVVQKKGWMGEWDTTLEGTLTALWGLTDDTHSSCTRFLQCDGLELYKELLETYCFNPRVMTQVLGLLNNVSEMEDLRVHLMDEELLQLVVTLMELREVDVSYFAGGFLANVTSDSAWILDATLRHGILTKLHSAVMSWTPPDRSIVSYRTLRPFYSLLRVSQPSAVQLWALWGIKHICTHNVSRYRPMLKDTGGLEVLRTLTSDPDTHIDVRSLAVHTLRLVEG